MRVERDLDDITTRLHREAISRPLLASRPRRRENAFLTRILRAAAGYTLCNGRAQRFHFGVLFLLLALQQATGCADNFGRRSECPPATFAFTKDS